MSELKNLLLSKSIYFKNVDYSGIKYYLKLLAKSIAYNHTKFHSNINAELLKVDHFHYNSKLFYKCNDSEYSLVHDHLPLDRIQETLN